jgi:hypothetical protein
VKPALKPIAAVLAGTVLLLLLSLLSGVVLSHDRLTVLLRNAFADGTLSNVSTETWIECSVLTMNFVRDQNAFINAIDTR